MNLQMKREQEDAMQVKKSIALKGTQGDSPTKDSDIEDDEKKVLQKEGSDEPNFKKNEYGPSICFECNKLGHIKKDCPKLKDEPKKFKKKALYVGLNESEPSDSEDEKSQEANLSITNPNICLWQMKMR